MGTVTAVFRLPALLGLPRIAGDLLGAPARMAEESCRVGERTVCYGLVEGPGETVVLVHGWGLSHRSYRAAAEALANKGFRVVLPDLPGFGGSSELDFSRLGLGTYASAVRAFLEECHDVGGEPVHLVGHSFGGAVAARLAHDEPDLVRSVVLVSSVSGPTWTREDDGSAERLLSERPIWDWGLHLVRALPTARFPVAALDVLLDLSRNMAWHLPSICLSARLICQADLTSELTALGRAGTPVSAVWAASDTVVPHASFEDQCRALGCDGTVVEGDHGWPLSRPAAFGEVVAALLRRRE